jgi:hypothetical protein
VQLAAGKASSSPSLARTRTVMCSKVALGAFGASWDR